mmetsp:Transcript_1138/g.4066  ORF Transcript_1138/g.4066 Transcript_1138/m.4066 type:complete len:325 (+) Transcript_1138:74-1048(+)
MNGSIYVGRFVYEHRSLTSPALVVATWPFTVLNTRMWIAYGQGDLADMPVLSIKTIKEAFKLCWNEARDMFKQGLRLGLFPGVLAGVATHQVDWMVKELVGSIIMDQQDVAEALDQRTRVLGALDRRIKLLPKSDPTFAATLSTRAQLDNFTPLQVTGRSVIANLIASAFAATVSYPLRVITYKMITGQVVGSRAAWNMLSDRDQHSEALWKGFPVYLGVSVAATLLQQIVNYQVAQIYDEIDGATSEDGTLSDSNVSTSGKTRANTLIPLTLAIATACNVATAPFSAISIHQRLGLTYKPAFQLGSILQALALSCTTGKTLEQ